MLKDINGRDLHLGDFVAFKSYLPGRERIVGEIADLDATMTTSNVEVVFIGTNPVKDGSISGLLRKVEDELHIHYVSAHRMTAATDVELVLYADGSTPVPLGAVKPLAAEAAPQKPDAPLADPAGGESAPVVDTALVGNGGDAAPPTTPAPSEAGGEGKIQVPEVTE